MNEMRKAVISGVGSCLVLLVSLAMSAGVAFAQKAGDRIRGEGRVVAYQAQSRCPECPGFSGGIGVQVERWIVRVERWSDMTGEQPEFVLVKYEMYDQSPSEEMLRKKLTFSFRASTVPRSSVVGCIGSARNDDEDGPELKWRDVRLSDSKIISPVTEKDLIAFQEFPCFIVNEMPKSNEQENQ